MVAYSFRKEFVPSIVSGLKRQTVRGHRRRHTRPGEKMQLFTGMRTRHCVRIIPDPLCTDVFDLRLDLTALADQSEPESAAAAEECAAKVRLFLHEKEIDSALGKQLFAASDGFGDMVFAGSDIALSPWAGLVLFWMHHHGAVDFRGVIIHWERAS